MLQIYTGTGKGKTSAALGVALRAYGYDKTVVMFSFFKNDSEYGEVKAVEKLRFMKIIQVGRDSFVNFHNPDKIDLNLVQEGWEKVKKTIINKVYDVVILDEFNLVLETKMLSNFDVIRFLSEHQHELEIILTGRGAPVELINIADLVTDMQEIKHYLNQGIVSRNGFDH